MQTTLLGLAIAIILALVSALVAPLVVDWNQYRSVFENEASRLTGLAVRVNGKIDASILPSPRIKLRNVEVGDAGREPRVRAATIELEVGLGPLLRGEVQATQMRIVAPQISLGVDRSGAIDWPVRSPSFNPDALTISGLTVEDARVVLTDAASGARLVLQKLWFNGDIRTFSGPFKGEGAFVADDQLYGYRISGGRVEDDGGLKLRLGVDPSDRPLTTEVEGTLRFENGVPHFDGTLALARPAGAELARGERVMSDPWHLSGRIRVTPASASLEDIALQYGPDERALNFSGSAELTLSEHPRLEGTVAARQLDVDRALATPDLTHRPPLLVVKSFVETFVAGVKPPMPVMIGVALDAVTVGATTIQSVHGDVRFDDSGWELRNFEFRAPGFTQVNVSGRLDGTPQGLAFRGPASLESADLKTLVAWLEGRGDQPAGPTEALTAKGEVTIASNRIALDRLTAAVDQENVEGRLAYTWAVDKHPAVLDGELRAGDLDIDALVAFAKAAASDSTFEIPHEVALGLDIGKATFAGVEGRMVNARIKVDAGVLRIDRLSIADLGGAALDVAGRIDELSSQPRGRLAFAVDAKALDGVAALLGRFAPRAAESLRHFGERLAPARLHGILTLDRAVAAGTAAKLVLDGQLGATRLSLGGEAKGELAQPAGIVVTINSRLDADDGGALVRLLGLDGVIAVDLLPGQMKISAAGPLNGDLRVNGFAAAGGFSTSLEGNLRLSGEEAPTGRVQVKASAADIRPLQRTMTGQASAASVAATASATVTVAGEDFSFNDLAATAAKTTLRGHLALKLSNTIAIDGGIRSDDVDAAALSALMLGLPSAAPGTGAAWSAEPIGAGAFTAMNGAVTFRFERAALTPTLVARALSGVVRFQPSDIAVNDIGASLADGRLSGALTFHHDARELAARGHVELSGANAAKLLSSNTNAVGGLLTVKLQGDGLGLSPEGLAGSLRGNGTITLKDAHFAGIDPAAFDAAVRAADLGAAIEPSKIRAAVSSAMDNSRLAVPQGDAEVTIASGQVLLATTTLQAPAGAELSLGGILDLNKDAVDARLTLSGQPAANALIQARPEVTVTVKGPLAAPTRTVDVSELVSWLTLRAAELQTRRLESIEANRREEVLGPVMRPPSPAIRFVPLGTPLESATQANASSVSVLGPRGFDRLLPEAPPAPPNDTRSDAETNDAAAATANAGTPDPPRRRSLAPATPQQTAPQQPAPQQTAPQQPAPQQPTPQQPAARSPWDFLFRSQN